MKVYLVMESWYDSDNNLDHNGYVCTSEDEAKKKVKELFKFWTKDFGSDFDHNYENGNLGFSLGTTENPFNVAIVEVVVSTEEKEI